MTAPTTTLLETVAQKVAQKERLSFEEGVALLRLENPEEKAFVGKLANRVRKERVGDTVCFASTLFIYPTNLCELNCPFCSFYAKPGWKKAWSATPKQLAEKVKQAMRHSLTEVHIVGGLWRDCTLDYYQELFALIKELDPNLHIKALTSVEYDFLSKLHGISVEEVFKKMIDYGLDSLPGGGAEILVEEIRKKIAPGKISTERYLEIHKLAHRMGLKSNITMLFNHIETEEDIITHLCKVRELQDETGGYVTFIPLKFGVENNALGKRKQRLKPKDIPLVYAVSRLLLDNIRHLKVLWNYVGVNEALNILNWGANDLSSTNQEEKVIEMAGGTQVNMNCDTMRALIKQCQRVPLLTHSGAMP